MTRLLFRRVRLFALYILVRNVCRTFDVVIAGRGMLDFPSEEDPLPVSNSEQGHYKSAAVVTNTEPCSAIGRDILSKGGSAVDAAIASLLCEGLCGMQNMGIGGGMFMTIYIRETGEAITLDARESAPIASVKDMYKGKPTLSAVGPLAVAVPGELMGYWEAHKRFGKLPWKDLFAPAISMCLNGIPVNHRLGVSFSSTGMEQEILESPSLREILAPNGSLPKSGDLLRMPTLAQTLTTIANDPNGPWALYNGVLTDAFIHDIQKQGGIITKQDLWEYRAKWASPITQKLAGGYTLHTLPPPGCGAVLAFILSVLDGQLKINPRPNAHNYMKIAEAFKYGYALRTGLGDPEFTNVSEAISKLNDKHFRTFIKKKIENTQNTSSSIDIYGADYYLKDDHGTINIVVLAPNGDAVAATSTINTLFGSLIGSPSTGIILNNEMDDFSAPNIVNSFGVTPSPANFIKAKKRPLSSACPSIVLNSEGDVRIVVGAAGGTHIISSTAQVIINNLWLSLSIKQAVDMPRIHHQLLPMILKYECGIPKCVVDELTNRKHKMKKQSPHSSVTAIAQSHGEVTAIYDFRRGGSTAGF
ncbi:glutathione hydrolase 1 proenzyme-like isoform X1 [Cimex lectularius]|uniref:Gamma-glutamyltransferase n=2 Tax=Cimex lectularius TaxID=79782 RepID=A0A8I6RP20_CIMLE|nr:glutathione hydrolase 1 proenzyme-like isoform X1 [Cimex lectularius]